VHCVSAIMEAVPERQRKQCSNKQNRRAISPEFWNSVEIHHAAMLLFCNAPEMGEELCHIELCLVRKYRRSVIRHAISEPYEHCAGRSSKSHLFLSKRKQGCILTFFKDDDTRHNSMGIPDGVLPY